MKGFGRHRKNRNSLSMRRKLALITAALMALAVLIALSGCGTKRPDTGIPAKTRDSYRVNGKWYHPITDSDGFHQSGTASWYGAAFHGKKTANGETYNMHARTAAHKTLPLGTFVLVRRLDNGKETIVRINDRGPFVRGRVIDLSRRAARDIDMIGPGTAPVEIAAMEKGIAGSSRGDKEHEDFYTGDFAVQVGAFVHKSLAEKLCTKLRSRYEHVFITTVRRHEQLFYRVRVGRFRSLAKAEQAEARLVLTGYPNAFAVAADDR